METPLSPRHVLDLRGAAYERGRAQAALCPERVAEVTLAVTLRVAELGPALADPKVIAWLDAQHAFTRDNDPDAFVEIQGIAEGFGIAPDALFAWLFADVIADLAGGPSHAEAATAWATPQGRTGRGQHAGPLVVKNRDVHGTLGALQCVFRHDDPDLRGRRILCVGTLGLPGAVSSGINSRGLAVADVHVGTKDHGEGWLRSLLMTHLLRECATVAEAIAFVLRVPHAGGGALVLGDGSGAVAAVDLAHGRVGAEEPLDAGFVARTGHFVTERLSGREEAGPDGPEALGSYARLATLEHGLRDLPRPFTHDAIKTLMSRHGDSASAALCRHDERRDLATASCVIYDCRASTLHISFGAPCTGAWVTIEP